jgi:hypothetical protein
MANPDPARTPQRTYEERRKMQQDACKKTPCHSVETYPRCVFCPHEKRKEAK